VTRRSHRWALLAAFALGCLSPRPACADGSKAAAEALFEEGRALVLQKRFAEACPKLAESLRLDPGTGTHLWLADCYEKSGQTASAWAEFREAAGTASQQHDPRAAVAQKRADELEARLTKLVIVVPPEAELPGLEIRRDGLLVPATALRIPIPVDPGVHAVAAIAPQHQSWSTTVQLPVEPGVVSLNIPTLEPEPALAPPAPPPEPTRSVETHVQSDRSGSGEQDTRGQEWRVTGVVVGAVGLAGLAFGAYAGLHAKSVYGDATSSGHCLPDNECDPAGKQARSTAFEWATVSTVSVGVGLAAAAAGAIVFFSAPKGSSALGVAATHGGGKLVVQGAF
jgi:hypothetical protein